MDITITDAEKDIIRKLVDLYVAVDELRHSRACECEQCFALDIVDHTDHKTFAALEEKIKH